MMYVIPLGRPFGIGYGIVVFRQGLPSGGLVSTNKARTKKMFSNAEIMAIVTISALFMYPALIGYVELVLWVKLTIKKLKYRKKLHMTKKSLLINKS